MTSLHSNKTPDNLLSEMEFLRAADTKCSILIVEGDDDSRFWKSRVATSCRVVIAGGRSTLLKALSLIDQEKKTQGVAATADADFDRLEDCLFQSANITYTDCHDLETTLAKIALPKVLSEFGNPKKIAKLEQSEGVSIEQAVIQRCLSFGLLRWINKRANELSMSWMALGRFVLKQWVVCETLHAVAVENGLAPDVDSLQAAIDELLTGGHDLWNICVGHDLVNVISTGLKQVIGEAKGIGGDKVASALRTAAERVDLDKLEMFRELRRWEKRNRPYLILS